MKKVGDFDRSDTIGTTEFQDDLSVTGAVFDCPVFRLVARKIPSTGEPIIHLILPPAIEDHVLRELLRTPTPKFARLYRDSTPHYVEHRKGGTSTTLMFDDGTDTPFAFSFNDDSWLFFAPHEINDPEPGRCIRLVVNTRSEVALILPCVLGGDGSEPIKILTSRFGGET